MECGFLEMVKSKVEIKELMLVLAFCLYQIRTLNRSPRKNSGMEPQGQAC